MTRALRIGTRGSALALIQARWVADRLGEHGVATELVTLRTAGDDRAPDTAWGEGAFVRRIEAALLDGSVDVAVHSAKDVPTDEHPALTIAAYPVREDPRDALVCRDRGHTLATLPPGSRVGTDSPRRTAFVLARRPDLVLHPLHGNVDTRLRRLDDGETDALVLAVAGLTRLGRTKRIDEVLPLDVMAAAPGQGALAVQVRADDTDARGAVARIDDPATRLEVEVERAILSGSGGGCRSPIGVTARAGADGLEIIAAAARDWVPARGAAAIPVAPVGWLRGTGAHDERQGLVDSLATDLMSFRDAPRVLVGRPFGQAAPLLAALLAAGMAVSPVPAIEIRPADGAALDAAVAGLKPGTLVVVTSANAVEPILRALDHGGTDPAGLRWAAVGEATAAAVLGSGVQQVITPQSPDSATLAAALAIEPGDDVLLPRSDLAAPALPDALRARGARVREVVAYRTLEAPEASRARLADVLEGPIDVLLATSGSVARGFAALAGDAHRARILATPVIASGERTARAAREAGYATVVVAPAPDPASLAAFTANALGFVRPDSDGAR